MIITGAAKAKTNHGAAGISFLAPNGMALFLKRGDKGDHPGTWCWPGGHIESGEDAYSAAQREAREELGIDDTINGEMEPIEENDHFTTFRRNVEAEFQPTLNDEHTEFVWADPKDPPQPLHPGVARTLSMDADFEEGKHPRGKNKTAKDEMPLPFRAQQRKATVFALDKTASARSVDADGRLHLNVTNISKSNICPYLGKEIPDFEDLGLKPNQVYKLLRDPEELAKGAATFNNLPLLSEHVPVSAEDHQPELVIGSTGSHAEFSGPYLRNSLVVWVKDAIDLIESDEMKELSSAYRYRADMTPGNFAGEKYDGVMRDIIGNHVALVKEGRAGSDVVVGDAKLSTMENITMAVKKVPLSRKAAMLMGSAAAFLQPKLAADAKLDLGPMFAGITTKNYKAKRKGLMTAMDKALEPILAQDASAEGLVELLDALAPTAMVEDADPLPQKDVDANDDDMDDEEDTSAMDAVKEFLKDKLSAEDMAACDALFGGGKDMQMPKAADADVDADKDKDKDKDKVKDSVTPKAMDAAISKAVKLASDAQTKKFNDIRAAEALVRPYIGETAGIAFDSAAEVFENCFEALKVDVEGIHPSAYAKILSMQTLPGEKTTVTRTNALGMDAAGAKSFSERNPNASRIQTM